MASTNPTEAIRNEWFTGGFVQRTTNEGTDTRFITDHDNTTGTLTLNIPFENLAVGESLTAFPGCNHTTNICTNKFNNIVNYGGFPYIPMLNPMDGTSIF